MLLLGRGVSAGTCWESGNEKERRKGEGEREGEGKAKAKTKTKAKAKTKTTTKTGLKSLVVTGHLVPATLGTLGNQKDNTPNLHSLPRGLD